jgi:hypothetical protein
MHRDRGADDRGVGIRGAKQMGMKVIIMAAIVVLIAALIAANGPQPIVKELVAARAAQCGDWEALFSPNIGKAWRGISPTASRRD